MDMPIVFLAPPDLEGVTGYQRTDDETHSVVGVFFDDGTEVPDCGYSYRALDV